MKRRIGVFANAWAERHLSDALEGLKKAALDYDFDIFIFVSHAAPGMGEAEQREEKRIYSFPDMREFDGIIIYSSTMNFSELVYDLRDRAIEANIPIVSVGNEVEGTTYVGMDSLKSMKELVEHLVTVHGVTDACFIGGPKDNENSIARLLATKMVFENHKLELKDENIRYTDWSVRNAMNSARELLQCRKDKLPQAVICANDSLAMATCTEIEKLSLKVPDDIIVTGFDNLHDGQVFFPSLCTVGQNDYEVGYQSFKSLIGLMNGEKVDDVIIENRFINNRSCGCENHNSEMIRLIECKSIYYEKIRSLEFGWDNNGITNSTLMSTKFSEIRNNLNNYFSKSDMFGLPTTYVLVDENAKLWLDGNSNLKNNIGYSDELDVIAAVDRGNIVPCDKIKRSEIIPGYKKEDNVSRVFIFMPIHFEDWVFGCAVVEDWLEGIATGKIKIFVDNFNKTANMLKQNIALEYLNSKLTDLYIKDSLTGMYNRFGFDSEGGKIFNACKENNEHMLLMFIDINRMKLINDYYGHLQGDVAIKTVAEVIKNKIKKDWIAIRFGGDEFLVIGKCENEEEANKVKKSIYESVKAYGKNIQLPYYLSASCGYLYFKPEGNKSLDEYVKQADEDMYNIKAKIHLTDMELRKFEEACKNNPIHK